MTWELGATYSTFPNFAFYNYSEFFAGLLSNNWNARLYFAPDYFGRNHRTLYAEFNYAHPLGEHVRLLGHVGALQGAFGSADSGTGTLDASLGVGAKLNNVDIQLTWVATNRANYFYPVAIATDRHEWC